MIPERLGIGGWSYGGIIRDRLECIIGWYNRFRG